MAVTGKRGIDIGRDQHLDWTLPDPTRYISAKHCEVRYRDGGYWLYDVSTNTKMKSRVSRTSGLPNHNSASEAAFASLSTVIGNPVALLTSSAGSQSRHLKWGTN